MALSLTPEGIVSQMLQQDSFSQWLGIKVLGVSAGNCELQMATRAEMLNGYGILHGGICYSLADSALAFASNAQGSKAFSIETSISHLIKVTEGETLTATANQIGNSTKIAVFQVEIKNSKAELVALFKGTVYKSSES
jgi:acyl-CoA thioesterase